MRRTCREDRKEGILLIGGMGLGSSTKERKEGGALEGA